MSFEGFGGAPDKEKAALPAGLSHAVLVCGGTEEERNKKALYIAKTAHAEKQTRAFTPILSL